MAQSLDQNNLIHHDLKVELRPADGFIRVVDKITFHSSSQRQLQRQFSLHSGLVLSTDSHGIKIKRLSVDQYLVTLPAKTETLVLSYEGKIQQALRDKSDSPGKTQQYTRGWIGDDGVFLDGSAPWYPVFSGDEDGWPPLVNFDLQVRLPEGWKAVSQGESISTGETGHWRELQPQDDIYLIANRFKQYQKQTPNALVEVYLHNPDAKLANQYLEATADYLSLYTQLIGPYPYSKFALVENFWETGYGMPSFTLLGPQVIRLPFIIHTSYPHEILHNWFGNGVFVDYSQGNWSEGLTAYLADYWLKERRGKGAEYRRNALQGYAHYVDAGNEFPLKAFRARHGDSSQAIGYSKAMMMFHMLRQHLGDQLFFQGLRNFYQKNKFRRASYSDLQAAWEQVSKQSLQAFFDQWLNRTGAPVLAISNVSIEKEGSQYQLSAKLSQTQKEAVFKLQVPIKIQFGNQLGELVKMVELNEKSEEISLVLPHQPIWITVDADADVFRRLDPAEIPATLSGFFGSRETLIVLPSNAPELLQQAYRTLADTWQEKRQHGWDVILDKDIKVLPEGKAILILGQKNRFRAQVMAATQQIELSGKDFCLGDAQIDADEQSLVLALNAPGKAPRVFISASEVEAVAGLTRKIPHYGKYSYLVFDGIKPTNRLKGQWQINQSPLSVCVPPLNTSKCTR